MDEKYLAPPTQKSMTDMEFLRVIAYRNESDPLFFKWQASESMADKQAWLDKRREIKDKYNESSR